METDINQSNKESYNSYKVTFSTEPMLLYSFYSIE